MKRRSCAFTGHCLNKLPWRRGKTAEGCVRLREVLDAQITILVESGVTDFLSGMAEVDIWAAQATFELRSENHLLKLHRLLPCKEIVIK